MEEKIYTIRCDNCGVRKNSSSLECDCCKQPILQIKFGCFWYTLDELERDNIFN